MHAYACVAVSVSVHLDSHENLRVDMSMHVQSVGAEMAVNIP